MTLEKMLKSIRNICMHDTLWSLQILDIYIFSSEQWVEWSSLSAFCTPKVEMKIQCVCVCVCEAEEEWKEKLF